MSVNKLIAMLIFTLFAIGPNTSVLALTNADVALSPPNLTEARAKPKVILSVDTSGSMNTPAYGKTYDAKERYVGIFDEAACYLYDDTVGKKYFYRVKGVSSGASCMGWDGSFLNWLSMRRIDILREILIGSSVEVQTIAGAAYTRRDASLLNVKAEKYIKFISEGTKLTRSNAFGDGLADTVSPFGKNAYIHYCENKVFVTKNNRLGNNQDLSIRCKNANTPYNNDPSATNNSSEWAKFELRVLSENVPSGLVQQASDQFDFGVAVFRANGDAGSMRPCFKAPALAQKSGIEECIDGYAGAPLADVINIIEFHPVNSGTPIAETLYEIGGYIKQSPLTSRKTRYFNVNNKLGSYDLGTNGNPLWDPYYSKDVDALVACTDIFVININDGAPSGDFENNNVGLKNIWGQTRSGEAIDAVAWSLRGDCRDDLAGDQDVKSFFVYADLSGDTSGKSLRVIREGAAIGGAEITKNNNGDFVLVDQPFFAGDNSRDPFNSQSSGFDRNPKAQAPTSWDTNGDGEPDNLLLATSPEALKEALTRVLGLVAQNVSAGGAAAISSSSDGGDGVIVQALMYQKIFDDKNIQSVDWVGKLHAVFVDDEGNYREDGNGNAKLDGFDDDPIITYVNDPQLGAAVKRVNAPTTGNNLPPTTTIPLQDLRTVWNAEDQFYNLTNQTAITQRKYSDVGPQRYIFTATKNILQGGVSSSVVTSQDFNSNNFDYNDASWFGIDCTKQLLNNGDCQEKIHTIINYVRGVESPQTRSRTLSTKNGETRRYLLGDIVNSSPAFVGAPNSDFDKYDASYLKFKQQYANRRDMVYVGANDGMLHAFNAGFWNGMNKSTALTSGKLESEHHLGKEIWAYVPGNLWPHLQWLANPAYQHTFYVNGSPTVFDVKAFNPSAVHPDGWGTLLVVGLGFGGHPYDVIDGPNKIRLASSFVILDITDPERPPVLIDEITLPNLGYTVSKPAVAHRNGNWLLTFGSGPTDLINGVSDIAPSLYQYDLGLRKIVLNKTINITNTAYTGAITVADWDKDFNSDNAYFGLVEGIADGRLMNMNLATAAITTFYDTNAAITAPPSAFISSPDNWLFFGTGKLLVGNDVNISAQQSYYGTKVMDDGHMHVGTIENTTKTELKKNDKNQVLCKGCPAGVEGYPQLVAFFRQDSIAGWKVDLFNDLNTQGEPSGRNIGKALLLFQRVIFTDFVPPTSLCGQLGKTYLYALDFNTGTAGNYQIFEGSDENDTHASFTELADGLVESVGQTKDSKGNVIVHGQSEDSTLRKKKLLPPPEPIATSQGRVSWRQIILGL